MIKCAEIISFMEELAPKTLKEEWDNTGLLVGNRDAAIKRVLVCLDITMASIKEALSRKADLIITHHPVIFNGVKRLDEQDFKGKQLYKLIQNGLCVYAAHTNLDYADKGVNTCLALALGVRNTEILGNGPGKCGKLERKYSMDEFISYVKKRLNVPFLRIAGYAPSGIRKVAVFSGSFDGNLDAVIESNCDVLITGDLKYHTALDAVEAGLCIIDAGHFGTERVVLPYLAKELGKAFPSIEVIQYQEEKDPFITY